jgi:hypothetical protein
VTLFDTLSTAESAPQQATGAANAFVVKPYCIAQAIELAGQEQLQKQWNDFRMMKPGNAELLNKSHPSRRQHQSAYQTPLCDESGKS